MFIGTWQNKSWVLVIISYKRDRYIFCKDRPLTPSISLEQNKGFIYGAFISLLVEVAIDTVCLLDITAPCEMSVNMS